MELSRQSIGGNFYNRPEDGTLEEAVQKYNESVNCRRSKNPINLPSMTHAIAFCFFVGQDERRNTMKTFYIKLALIIVAVVGVGTGGYSLIFDDASE